MKEIPLSQGKVALVDAGDFEWLNQWKWSACKSGKIRVVYRAMRVLWNGGNQKAVMMHRLILNAQPGQIVDHINGNPLDNRRENLRICTQRQNTMNTHGHGDAKTSKFKGVYWQKDIGFWRARFRFTYLGTFKDELEAARAYDKAALAADPEFARLNFPPQEVCHQ